MIKEIFEKIKRDKWTIQSGNLLPPLILIIGAMTIVMTLFEMGKHTLFPHMSMWEDHLITAVFCTVPVFIIGYLVMKKIQRLYQQAVKEIAERKRVEEELSKSQKMLENITQGITENILLISKDFRILWANKAALEAYGSGIIGDCCYKATHQSESRCEPPFDPCPISELQRTGKPVFLNHLHHNKHGNKRHVEVGAYPVLDEKGEIFKFIHVCKDVTERKRAEEALRESEESYRQLVEQPFDGVFVRSQDKILFMNKAGARILGVEDPSQFVGKSVLNFLHPDYHEFVRKRVQEVYETGKFVPLVEEKFIRFDGKVIDVEVAATAFTYGGAPAVQVIFRDITERKQAEEEREKLVHDLQKALSEVGTLKGILPICASCKKIRDDKGYWRQIEAYIRDHSEAEFSHGICPDCMKKLYGDFLKEEDISKKQ